MSDNITGTLTETFRKALKMVIQETCSSSPLEHLNIDTLLGIEWKMATSLADARDILKNRLYDNPKQTPDEIRPILKACFWTMNDYLPVCHLLTGEGGESVYKFWPGPQEILDRLKFYTAACQVPSRPVSCVPARPPSEKTVPEPAAEKPPSPISNAEAFVNLISKKKRSKK